MQAGIGVELAEDIADDRPFVDRNHGDKSHIFVIAPAWFALQSAGALQPRFFGQGNTAEAFAVNVQKTALLTIAADGLHAISRRDFACRNQVGGFI